MFKRKSAVAMILTLIYIFSLFFSGTAFAADFDTELAEVKKIANIINYKEEADLYLKNVKILDVYSEQVYDGSILINNGKIVGLNPDATKVKSKKVIDGKGMYAIPGLIDAHFHFDSQLVTPTALAEAMVPHGTTSIIGECCDLISAAGDNGLEVAKILFNDHEKLPYRIYSFSPGKKVKFEIVKEILDWDFIIGLGELNNISFVNGNEEDYKKTAYARSINKLLDGHVDAPDAYQANLFAAVGIINDHDNWWTGGLTQNFRAGLANIICKGLGRIEPTIPDIVKEQMPTENIMFATDNLAVETMVKSGGIDAAVQESIALGLNPIKAIKMATYNTAKHFKLEEKIGSITPGRYADIILVKDLKNIKPISVFKGGELVAQNGVLLKNATIDYSKLITKAKPSLHDFKAQELEVKPLEYSEDKKQAKVQVFNFYGFGPAGFMKEEWLPVQDGKIVNELNGEKLLHFSIIERNPKAGTKRSVTNGYIRQYSLDKGAVAIAFSSPSPNMMTLGTNIQDMYSAIKEADKHPGGFVTTVDSKVQEVLPMNIYGMMTEYSSTDLVKRAESLTNSLKKLGNTNPETAVTSLIELFYIADRHNLLK